MSYLEREYPSASRRNDDLFTVYVGNLPEELNKDGIAQIFQAFGEIHIISPPGARWAFVGYKTYREAEHAIRALNDRGPLYLKVAFQKKKSQQKLQHFDTSVAEPLQENLIKDFRFAETEVATNPNCRSFVPGMLGSHFTQCATYNHDSDGNSVYPSDMDPNIYNPFESVGRYAETNAMWSRGCVNVDDYGRRYVSMGRGFTRYHIPERHPNLDKQIGRIYEKRHAGLYEYGEDSLQSSVGKCQLCTRVTTLQCEQCAGFYCSRECQLSDWSRHKMECKTIPGLVGGLEVASISRSSSDDQLLVPRKPGGMDLRALGVLRRPKTGTKGIAAKPTDRETHEQNFAVEEAATDHNRAPFDRETRREGVIKENQAQPPVIDLSQSSPQQKSSQNFEYNQGMQKRSNGSAKISGREKNRRYDENSNNRFKTNARQQGGFRNDQRSVNQNRENNLPKEVQSNAGHFDEMREKSKSDLTKMDEELVFRRDCHVEKQAPSVDTSSHARAENVNIAKPIDTLISKSTFTDVIVVYSMPDKTFWVHRKKDVKTIEEMMQELQTKTQCYPAATKLVIGEMYAVKYNGFWHRATLVSKSPPSIFYVDFGNEEPPQTEEFRLLNDFPKYPPYAIRMRLSADSKIKNVVEDRKLSVKMINVDGNGIVEVVDDGKMEIVTAEQLERLEIAPTASKTPDAKAEIPKAEISVPNTSKVAEAKCAKPEVTRIEKKSAIKLPSTIDSLEINDHGYIQVYTALNNDSYAVCVLSLNFTEQYQMVFETLTETCNATSQIADFKPQLGDFVCGKRESIWLRGYVFSLGPPIRLALVDEARVSPVEQVLPMLEEFKEIYSFGAICTFQTPGSAFVVDEAAEFTVTKVETVAGERIVNAVLTTPEHLKDVKVTLKNWSPTPEQKGIGFAELKTNSEVCITAYSSERIMFVRCLDVESLERTQRITQNVAKWAQKAPKLNGPPAIGQLVIAKFTDGNYYRAIVTKIQDGKIGVSYVDYGNRDFTTIDELRILSDELKEERSCVAKIILKDIKTDVPPTQEVHNYLNLLVGREQKLFCTFEGIPSKDGVILTNATGECVNLKVNELLTPGWQREDPDKDTKCFLECDLEYAKLGDIGQTTKALVLYASVIPFRYFMCPYDVEHITHVTLTMPKMLQDYCESTKIHYIPRKGELCLAVYEGAWYRGVCLNPSGTPTQAQIHFIDFGNIEIVDHTNIRQMTKDFVSPAALGCICEVKNLGIELVNERVPENIKPRLDALIPLNDIVDVKIIQKVDEGDYVIELPQVRQKLVEEGLVKSL